ncbi:hypothetical protein F0562_007689 [Nyssa sinensis]|uniref:Xyloglucan endotransglucosylase/hydrolase n=1 Tax=Nyssa sinensis TaxID=561372 RepID=A0A5J5A6K8_9ASTE|nr:hypothetical protein F0562_007689 [Nyssa sinensis]
MTGTSVSSSTDSQALASFPLITTTMVYSAQASSCRRITLPASSSHYIFYVDEVPIREVVRNEKMGGDYPSKPMSLYATIWDASNWATAGGKFKVNYRYEPFVSEFKDLVLDGCTVDPIQQVPAANCDDKTAKLEAAEYAVITPERSKAMTWFREKYMYYSHCYDTLRYPVAQPECIIVPSEQELFKDSGRLKEAMKLKFGRRPRSHRRRARGNARRGGRAPAASGSNQQAAM